MYDPKITQQGIIYMMIIHCEASSGRQAKRVTYMSVIARMCVYPSRAPQHGPVSMQYAVTECDTNGVCNFIFKHIVCRTVEVSGVTDR